MENLNKTFLDYEGLLLYDELIKGYIKTQKEGTDEAIEDALSQLAEYQQSNDARNVANEQAIADNKSAIETLNGDAETEGSVANMINTVVGTATEDAVKKAIDDLVAEAPEAYDTLKEIADWISADETGTAALIERVTKAENAIKDLTPGEGETVADIKDYVDTQDKAYWDKIGSIENTQIEELF